MFRVSSDTVVAAAHVTAITVRPHPNDTTRYQVVVALSGGNTVADSDHVYEHSEAEDRVAALFVAWSGLMTRRDRTPEGETNVQRVRTSPTK
jgi:hypothetical protein